MKLNNAKEEWFEGQQVDLEALAKDLEKWLADNKFETQIKKAEDQDLWLVQARKTGKLRTILGSKRAFSIAIEGEPNKFYAKVGISEWIGNITAAAVVAFLTFGTAGILIGTSAAWSKKVQNDIRKHIRESVLMGRKSDNGLLSGIHLSPIEAAAKEIQIEHEKKVAALKSAHEIGAIENTELQEKIRELENQKEKITKILYLKDAKKNGVLTPEEFEAKKEELINGLC